jgi:hypothetical protein
MGTLTSAGASSELLDAVHGSDDDAKLVEGQAHEEDDLLRRHELLRYGEVELPELPVHLPSRDIRVPREPSPTSAGNLEPPTRVGFQARSYQARANKVGFGCESDLLDGGDGWGVLPGTLVGHLGVVGVRLDLPTKVDKLRVFRVEERRAGLRHAEHMNVPCGVAQGRGRQVVGFLRFDGDQLA